MRRVPDAVPAIFHDLAQARAALRWAAGRGRAVILFSPPGAALAWGARYFSALAAEAEAAESLTARWVLDCADVPGRALAALRGGVGEVRFTGPAEVAQRMTEIAAALGARVWTGDLARVDLRQCRGAEEVAARLDQAMEPSAASPDIVRKPRIG